MEDNLNQLTDQHNRFIDYMRISVTDRCNLSCVYCIPKDVTPKLNHADILTYEEILRVTKIAVDLGIVKIRLTGGEPLVRRGIFDFIPKVAQLPGLKELSLTTNGTNLKNNLTRIKEGGIQRINVSLDTLNRERYKKITGYDGFKQVWESLEAAMDLNFNPVKINVVLIKGLNEDEILDFARISFRYPFHIRFIEHMPLGGDAANDMYDYIPNTLIKEKLTQIGPLIPIMRSEFDGPAERFRFAGASGEIGFISPLSHMFCQTCNRLRLTAAGRLRACLLSDNEVDLIGPMRNGATDDEIREIFLRTVLTKPKKHSLDEPRPQAFSGQMSSIGG